MEPHGHGVLAGLDVISIRNLRTWSLIGVYPHEREQRQELRVDAWLGTDTRPPPRGRPVALHRLRRGGPRLPGARELATHQLVETLAEELAAIALDRFGASAIRLSVEKLGVIPGPTRSASRSSVPGPSPPRVPDEQLRSRPAQAPPLPRAPGHAPRRAPGGARARVEPGRRGNIAGGRRRARSHVRPAREVHALRGPAGGRAGEGPVHRGRDRRLLEHRRARPHGRHLRRASGHHAGDRGGPRPRPQRLPRSSPSTSTSC